MTKSLRGHYIGDWKRKVEDVSLQAFANTTVSDAADVTVCGTQSVPQPASGDREKLGRRWLKGSCVG